MTITKAYGLPTGGTAGGATFTPPWYGRSDYTHRWAAQSLRGITAPGGAPAYLHDMGPGALNMPCYAGTTFVDAGTRNPAVKGRTITLTSSPDNPNQNSSVWCINITGDGVQMIRTPGGVLGVSASVWGVGSSNTGINPLGWHVLGVVRDGSNTTLFQDGVKRGTWTLTPNASTYWALQPTTGTGDHYLGECVAWSGVVLPDADVIAVSRAMMAERGLA